MFDKTIVIPQLYKNKQLDFGEIAETLLFFGNVNIYLKDRDLEELIKLVPIDNLLVLVQEFGLNLYYTSSHLQFYQEPKGKYQKIGVGFLTRKAVKSQIIESTLKHYYPNRLNLSKSTQILIDNVKTYKHPDNITNQILDDFLSKEYTDFGLKQIISNHEVLKQLNFDFFRDDDDSYLYKCNYTHKPNTPIEVRLDKNLEKIFDPFIAARELLLLAGQEQSSISTVPLVSRLMTFKSNSLIKTGLDKKNIELFKETFIPEFHNISTVINSEPTSINEFIRVLDKSKQFRECLKNSNEETNLIREFYKKSTEKSWIDKLPTKGTRFLIFTGAGLITDALLTGGIGTLTGIALSAGDNFILDKLLNKWNPNYQINQGVAAIDNFTNLKK